MLNIKDSNNTQNSLDFYFYKVLKNHVIEIKSNPDHQQDENLKYTETENELDLIMTPCVKVLINDIVTCNFKIMKSWFSLLTEHFISGIKLYHPLPQPYVERIINWRNATCKRDEEEQIVN